MRIYELKMELKKLFREQQRGREVKDIERKREMEDSLRKFQYRFNRKLRDIMVQNFLKLIRSMKLKVYYLFIQLC